MITTNDDELTDRIMLNRLLAMAKNFYKDPKNVEAFEAWRKNKEVNNEYDNDNSTAY